MHKQLLTRILVTLFIKRKIGSNSNVHKHQNGYIAESVSHTVEYYAAVKMNELNLHV